MLVYEYIPVTKGKNRENELGSWKFETVICKRSSYAVK